MIHSMKQSKLHIDKGINCYRNPFLLLSAGEHAGGGAEVGGVEGAPLEAADASSGRQVDRV